ncbi:MAG: hypothetical protein AB1730_23195 [Myxococcota bacterium]
MDVYLDGKRISVSDRDLVGEGGEACVYRHGALALKLFHPPAGALGQRLFDFKVTKLARFPSGLPREVVAPEKLVRDRQNRVLGYLMPLVPNAEGFGRLASRKWRAGAVSNGQVTALFQALHAALSTSHARAVCPECRALGPLVTRQVLRTRGRCTARTAFETSGRILASALQGGLRYVYEENGSVRREDGAVVLAQPASPHMRFAISGPSTWVADAQGRALRVVHGQVVERAQTEVRLTTPVLAASSSAAYRVEQGWLTEQLTGARVGQVLEGQAWLWTGERLGLGSYRAGGVTVAFLLRAGRPGLKQLADVTWTGRIVEADAVFDAQHALLTVVTEANGREVVRRWLFDESGARLGYGEGTTRGHAALLSGRAVVAIDVGLVGLKRDSGHLLEAVQFPDTHSFVSAGDEVLANTDGSLFVVGARDITQLTLT